MKIRTIVAVLALFVAVIGVTWQIATDVARQDFADQSSPLSPTEPANEDVKVRWWVPIVAWVVGSATALFPSLAPNIGRFIDAISTRVRGGPEEDESDGK